MRLIVARCEVRYSGRLDALLPEALRLIMVKADGSVLVHADAGGYKPLNWMTPPTVIEEIEARAPDDRPQARRRHRGPARDRAREVLSDVSHDLGEDAALSQGRRRGAPPGAAGRAAALVRRGLPARAPRVADRHRPGRPDVPRRRRGWVAVEIKRVAGIDAVEQLTRYLERIRLDPAFAAAAGCWRRSRSSRRRACSPRAAEIECVEVDLAVLRGEREPDLKLFAA